ncbi:helix-turn-helix domain-containing protein [Microcella alkalica]|uniref:GAF domain-containing protein n=1 Tax=Microcella alkalica TaxID=355930 RepID=A0A839E7Q9_9MICO|nr:GAF domain-containing protein [Microcella alkalica]MBA8847326.1 GAF domain-containing protein [Microcella alkalica]
MNTNGPVAVQGALPNAEGGREWAIAGVEVARSGYLENSIPSVVSQVAERARKLLGMDMCAVMLPDSTQSRLMVAGSAGLSGQYIEHLHADHPLTVDRSGTSTPSPSVEAFVSGRTVDVPDISRSEGMVNWRELALAEGYASLIATPLREGDRTNGVLVGYSRAPRHFPDEQVNLLEMFAVHAGATIKAAHTREELQATIDKLHAANAVLRRQRRNLELVDHQHRRLLQVMANDVGISGVVSMLAELLNCSVTVEDTDGKVVATATSGIYVSPPHRAEREVPTAAELLANVLSKRSGAAEFPSLDGEGASFWVTPVTLQNEVVALLWVGRPRFQLDDVGRLGLEGFALAVALEISNQRNVAQRSFRLSKDLVADMLVETTPADRAALLKRAAALGYDLAANHTIVVLRQDPSAGADGLRHGLGDTAAGVVREISPGTLVGTTGDDVVLLVPSEGSLSAEEVVEVIRADHRRRNPDRSASALVWGDVSHIAEVAAAYRAAHGAFDLLARRKPDTVSRIGDLGVAALLLSHGDPKALSQFADRLLGPLDDIDPRRAEELVDTLTVWLREDRSTSRAAERLLVHVNTVGYRLRALEDRLENSLHDNSFLVDLQMALAIRRINAQS